MLISAPRGDFVHAEILRVCDAHEIDHLGCDAEPISFYFVIGTKVFFFRLVLATAHIAFDALALAIKCGAGTVLHTGDFKMDQLPLDGRITDLRRFASLGEEGVANAEGNVADQIANQKNPTVVSPPLPWATVEEPAA